MSESRDSFQDIAMRLRKKVYERLDLSTEVNDTELESLIEQCILEESRNVMLPIRQRESLAEKIFNAIRRLDILQEILEDDAVTEIMINGSENIFLEKEGKIVRWAKKFESPAKLGDIAQKIAAVSNKIANESVPIVDTRLPDGSRVNIVLPPIAIDGPAITIRKFYDIPLSMEKLIEFQSITSEAAEFLKLAVRAKYNIFISGGTGSGKTTFLNILSNYIPADERIITIEDSAELQIRNIKNLVRLEARNANMEGKNAVTIRDLIKTSLRMRPDRIIVGEVRGAETLDMLQAMNTGHDGSLSTGHGNSPADMIARLETMVLMGMEMPVSAIRQQIASAINMIVHLARLRDKSRRVMQIMEISGIKNGEIQFNPLYEFRESGEKNGKVIGKLQRVYNEVAFGDKMRAAGIPEEKYMQPGGHMQDKEKL